MFFQLKNEIKIWDYFSSNFYAFVNMWCKICERK